MVLISDNLPRVLEVMSAKRGVIVTTKTINSVIRYLNGRYVYTTDGDLKIALVLFQYSPDTRIRVLDLPAFVNTELHRVLLKRTENMRLFGKVSRGGEVGFEYDSTVEEVLAPLTPPDVLKNLLTSTTIQARLEEWYGSEVAREGRPVLVYVATGPVSTIREVEALLALMPNSNMVPAVTPPVDRVTYIAKLVDAVGRRHDVSLLAGLGGSEYGAVIEIARHPRFGSIRIEAIRVDRMSAEEAALFGAAVGRYYPLLRRLCAAGHRAEAERVIGSLAYVIRSALRRVWSVYGPARWIAYEDVLASTYIDPDELRAYVDEDCLEGRLEVKHSEAAAFLKIVETRILEETQRHEEVVEQ